MTLLHFALINGYLIVFWALFQALSRGKRHTTFNRWYLLLAPILALGFAFLPSSGTVEISNSTVVELAQVNLLQSNENAAENTEFSWSFFIYTFGAIVSLVFLIRNLSIALKRPDAEFLNRSEGVNVYLLKSGRSSYSFFNRIYIDENQLENSEIIFLHEHAHCKGIHSIDILLFAFYRAIFWFNPVIYLLDKASKENHEFIADQYVLNQSIDSQEYGYSLLSAAFNCSVPMLGNGFNSKPMLLKRIQHLKFKNQINMKHVLIIPAVIAGLVITTTSMTFSPSSNEVEPKENVKMNLQEGLVQAEFKGGQEAMMNYLVEHLTYPKTLKEQKAKSIVYVSFTISKTGKVEKVGLAKGSEFEEFNEEAKRVVSGMPEWNPATKDGKAVASEMTLPIMFQLD